MRKKKKDQTREQSIERQIGVRRRRGTGHDSVMRDTFMIDSDNRSPAGGLIASMVTGHILSVDGGFLAQ